MAEQPRVDNEDMVIYGELADIAAASSTVFPVPTRARVRAVLVQLQVTNDAQITLSFASKIGTIPFTAVLPVSTPANSGIIFQFPLFPRANFFEAGESLLMTSDGGGTTGGRARFAVIFGRG